MVKDHSHVIAEFNEYVNMTAPELEQWLKTAQSSDAGWRKDGTDEKSVGQGSGDKIIEILRANPEKDPDRYTDEQVRHMRKVAAYCKRHLAQEAAGLEEKSPDEARKTKSYTSLKNWGHDPLRAQGGGSTGEDSGSKKSGSAQRGVGDDDAVEEDGAEEDGQEKVSEDNDKKAGDKRKKPGQHNGANKKRETRQGASSKKDGQDEDEDATGSDHDDGKENGHDEPGGKKPSENGPAKGETVSWKWGSGNPTGKVLDVKEDEATITTKRGNDVTRKGDAEDPAVILDTGKSKAIKLAHELN